MLSHQNLSANARQVVGLDPLPGTEDRIVGVLPLFHVFANTCVPNRTVANRGCMVLLPRFHAGQVLSTLDRTAATALPWVPTMYQALPADPTVRQTDFPQIVRASWRGRECPYV